MEHQELIPYSTVVQMVNTYNDARKKIEEAAKLLQEAGKEMNHAFAGVYWSSYHGPELFDCFGASDAESLSRPVNAMIKSIDRSVWKYLIEKMEVKRVASIARNKQIDADIEAGKMPPITITEVQNVAKSAFANAERFFEEALDEVWKYLRPNNDWHKLKTNDKFAQAIGKKVILWAVERGYYGNKYRVTYHRQDQFRAIDNVFHALDGKGFSATYAGELTDAIQAAENGNGETEYFRFKCYGNGNIHLEFKRDDLLTRLNAIVKDRTISSQSAAQEKTP